MKYVPLILLAMLFVVACAKQAAESVADTVIGCILPCDVTATDSAGAPTATDATAATLPDAVTP